MILYCNKDILGKKSGVFYNFPKICKARMNRNEWINIAKNIDEVKKKNLLTIYTTQLHRYIRVTQHFFGFTPIWILDNSEPLPLLLP